MHFSSSARSLANRMLVAPARKSVHRRSRLPVEKRRLGQQSRAEESRSCMWPLESSSTNPPCSHHPMCCVVSQQFSTCIKHPHHQPALAVLGLGSLQLPCHCLLGEHKREHHHMLRSAFARLPKKRKYRRLVVDKPDERTKNVATTRMHHYKVHLMRVARVVCTTGRQPINLLEKGPKQQASKARASCYCCIAIPAASSLISLSNRHT